MKPQRFLAAAGFGSRRACEQLILAGRVTLNGQPLTFNMDIQPSDDVRVDGKPISAEDELVYIALNKPIGMISDRGIPHEQSALDLVRVPQRLFAVGRLDKDATGLLLLTNDGELSYRLTHPSFEHEKEYRVLVEGQPQDATLQRWREGVWLNGEMTAPAQVSIEKDEPSDGKTTIRRSRAQKDKRPGTIVDSDAGTWLRVVLHEGRKRQIKRVAKLLGHPVKQLIRIRIGTLHLGNLKQREWRHLSEAEVTALKG
ncbi:MAG: rRNA pseudouridine synthase [Chloroflexi bacterium]|nr:rRNA pseudouridine synthase [Chloroflexota bacterium]